MSAIECPHEADVLSAVCTGQWPNRADAELRAHVATCAICADVVLVAVALENDALTVPDSARVPESGLVWWRAQVRAQQDAMRTAVRPITATQAIALACTVGLAGAFFGATSTWLQSWATWLVGLRSAIDWRAISVPPAISAAIAQHNILFIALASCLLLAPVAVWLVALDDK